MPDQFELIRLWFSSCRSRAYFHFMRYGLPWPMKGEEGIKEIELRSSIDSVAESQNDLACVQYYSVCFIFLPFYFRLQ